MLKRRPNETLEEILIRLDEAVQRAVEHEEYIDEINTWINKRLQGAVRWTLTPESGGGLEFILRILIITDSEIYFKSNR